MSRCPSKIFLAIAALGMAAVSASAQQTVVFSKPADMSADKANGFMDNPSHRVNADSYKAPQSIFQNTLPDAPPPRIFYQNQDPSAQEALNKRKNWTLLTPEQILGIQTPEQILGVDDPKGEKKLSLEEQFLLRQSRSTATNGRALMAVSRDDNNPFRKDPFNRNQDEQNPFWRTTSYPQNDKLPPGGRANYFDQLTKASARDAAAGGRVEDSPWAGVFTQPTAPKQTPEQIADMERFRAMMEPATPVVKPPDANRWNVAPAPAPSPYLEIAPKVNPVGADVMSLQDSSGHPTGIQPLPGIATQPKPVQPTRPTWQAQPPPWLSDKPQPHSLNRGF
jgi:hypothetical protein